MLVPPDRFQSLARLTESAFQGQSVSQYEGVCLHKDGRRIHVSVTGCPLRNSSGEVAAIAAILRDTSERHEAGHTRALLASIVESSNDAIQAVTLDGTIVSWNSGSEALFGYSSQEIIGRNAALLVPPDRSANSVSKSACGGFLGHVPYDLICMDIMMPEMDGHEAVREVRAMEHARGVLPDYGAKIIMTTTIDDIREVILCFKELCDEYLMKPIDLARLLAFMKSYAMVA